MRNSYIPVVILALMYILPCQAEEQKALTREEVARMLPYSTEGDAPGEYDNFLRLIDVGEPAYPALVEEMLQTKDSSKVSNIAAVFVRSKGDKTIPLQAMTQFVQLHGKEVPSYPGIEAVIRAMGALGGEKEAQLLRELLDLDNVLVRHVVEDSIKLIDKRQENMQREASSRDRHDRRNGEIAIEAQREADNKLGKHTGILSNSRTNRAIRMIMVPSLVAVVLTLIGLLYWRRRHDP